MAGFYYTQSGYPLYNTQASSALERAEFLAVQAGFDKLPTPTGFPNSLVKIRADQTGMDMSTATISPTGALAGISGVTSASGTWDLTGASAVRAPTATAGDNSTKVATTAFVAAGFASSSSPAFTGTPTAPTAVAGTNTNQLATTAFVTNQALTATLPGQTGSAGKFLTTDGTTASWGAAQPTLVSGTNIKTLNGNSILGSGDIVAGLGDVVGPAASVDGELVLYSGITGKLVKRSASSGLVKLTSGVVGTATAGSDFQAAITASGLLKGAGAGNVSAATAGTDYVTPTGTETLTNKTLTGTKETRVALAGAAVDLTTGNWFTKTIAALTTFSVSNVPAAGTVASFVLDLTNGGAFTITWWTGLKWAGGVAPTLSAAGRDVLQFFTHDGGTTWTGVVVGRAFA